MKLSSVKLPDELPGLILIEHADFGFMIAKWHPNRNKSSYDATGFRPGQHEGQAHPIAVTQLDAHQMSRVKRWAQLPIVDDVT